MIMNYLKQVIYEMKHQKMMTWVSISGTAVAIFLVMAFFMAEQVKTVEISPETDRGRIWAGTGVEFRYEHGSSSNTSMSYELIEKFYGNLDGIEMRALTGSWLEPVDVQVKGGAPLTVYKRGTDDNYWKIFDFTFLQGSPYTAADIKSDVKKVVLTRSIARVLFKSEEVVGRKLNISNEEYTVCGVIEDVNPILNNSFSQIYIPFFQSNYETPMTEGYMIALLKAKPGVSGEHLKKQVEARYATLNEMLKKGNERGITEVRYYGQPYSLEEMSSGTVSTGSYPDSTKGRRLRWIIYGLLIILPAINLSCMTKGRLRYRISEIGVRRAFGAKRKEIIRQMLGENMILTLVGGGIGLILSLIFMRLMASFFFDLSEVESINGFDAYAITPDLSMLFTWSSFFIALGACLVLNILSAGVPAWRASRVEPAIAISKSNK
jgi:putative ABC transport system permease protein